MLKDHSEMEKKLTRVAGDFGVKLTMEPSDKHRKALEELEGCDNSEFEQRFIAVVTKEHEGDVKLFQSESEHGGNEALKKLAAEVAPILNRHLETARSIGAGS